MDLPEVDHVLARRIEDVEIRSSFADEVNPFLRFRSFDHVYLQARDAGLLEDEFVAIVRRLDEAIARVDGGGFCVTPYRKQESLGNAMGFTGHGGVWVKDETRNVSGSHKGRHLFAVLLHLEVIRSLKLADVVEELVIASCGNAALAAAVLARAAQRPLRVFVPPDADAPVVERMKEMGAMIEVCERQPGVLGDPTYHRFRDAVAAGSIPFSCQGPDQALAVQGGKTIAWEMVFSDAPIPDRVYVQVGGGALASAVFSTFDEAKMLGRIEQLPRMHAVQTSGCYPLARAYERLVADIVEQNRLSVPNDPEGRASALQNWFATTEIDDVMHHAAVNRNRYMQPWEEVPHSIAHGILDDETYDWLAVVRAMLISGGYPVIVNDEDISRTMAMARRETGIDVCATGASSLAGLQVHARNMPSVIGERVTVLFTGHRRDAS